jgi:hypothetical protein
VVDVFVGQTQPVAAEGAKLVMVIRISIDPEESFRHPSLLCRKENFLFHIAIDTARHVYGGLTDKGWFGMSLD